MLQDWTFGTEEADCVVGAVAIRTLLLIQAPEAHSGVCMDLLPSFTSWDPFGGSGFDSSGIRTHPGTIVETDSVQLLVVSTASGVIHIKPCGPLEVVWTQSTTTNIAWKQAHTNCVQNTAVITLGMRLKPSENNRLTIRVVHRGTGLSVVSSPWSYKRKRHISHNYYTMHYINIWQCTSIVTTPKLARELWLWKPFK